MWKSEVSEIKYHLSQYHFSTVFPKVTEHIDKLQPLFNLHTPTPCAELLRQNLQWSGLGICIINYFPKLVF